MVVNDVAYSVTGLRGDSLYHNVSSRDGRLVFTFQLDNSVNNYNYSCVQNGGGTSGLIVLKNGMLSVLVSMVVCRLCVMYVYVYLLVCLFIYVCT